jgi:small redox-active disulfide protein 2
MTIQIRVLGTGCARCQKLYENTTQAVDEMGLNADVEKVNDIAEIARRGILATPALVVDDELVLAGHVPSVTTIRDALSGQRSSG